MKTKTSQTVPTVVCQEKEFVKSMTGEVSLRLRTVDLPMSFISVQSWGDNPSAMMLAHHQDLKLRIMMAYQNVLHDVILERPLN
jgi:hypothetical protein